MTVLTIILVYVIGIVTGACAYKISTNPTPKDLKKNADTAVKELLKDKDIKVE